jgi:hypothetical protein
MRQVAEYLRKELRAEMNIEIESYAYFAPADIKFVEMRLGKK